jgi:hypothetical protein
MMAALSHFKTDCQLSAIRQLEDNLVDLLQHEIDVVLSKAWSQEIIGEQVQSLAQSSVTSRVKAQKFVHVIRDRIKTDPSTFDTFLRILRSTPSLGHLADGLEGKLCPEHRVPSGGSNNVADLGGVPSLRPSMTSTPRSSLGNQSQSRHRDPPTATAPKVSGASTSAEYHTRTPPRGRKKRHGSSSDSPAHGLSGGQPKLDLAEDITDEESGYHDISIPVNVDSQNEESENIEANDGDACAPAEHSNDKVSFNNVIPVEEAESDYKPFSKSTGNECETDAKSHEPDNDIAAGGMIGQEIHLDATSQQQIVGGIQPTPEAWAARAAYIVNEGIAKMSEMTREIEELKSQISSLNKEVEASKDKNQKVEEMQDQMHEQEEELARYKENLAEKERELSSLQEKWKEEVQAAEDQLKRERVDHSREIEKIEEEMKLLQSQLQEKSTEAEKLRHEYDDLKTTTEATIKELREKLEEKTKEASKLKDEYHQSEEKRKKEIAQLDKTYKKKISELEELVQSQKEQARLKEENLQIKLKSEYMEKEIQRLKDENELKLKVKDLEKELAVKETQVEQVNKEEQARRCQEMDAQMKQQAKKYEQMDVEMKQQAKQMDAQMKQHTKQMDAQMKQQAKQHEEEKAKMREELKMEREQSNRKLQEMAETFQRSLSSVSSTSSNEMSRSRSNTGPSYNPGTDKDDTANPTGNGTNADKDDMNTITEDLEEVHLGISNSDKEDTED